MVKKAKKKLSLQEFSEIVGSFKLPNSYEVPDHPEQLNLFLEEKFREAESKIWDIIKDPGVDMGLINSFPGTLVYALSDIMHKAKKDDAVGNYYIPMVAIARILKDYTKVIYKKKQTYLDAPNLVGLQIRSGLDKDLFDKNVRADCGNAPDYACFSKLIYNFFTQKEKL